MDAVEGSHRNKPGEREYREFSLRQDVADCFRGQQRYYLYRLLPEEFSQAHQEGDLHIHDLDFYGKTLTCIQIPLGKLLQEGFDNGHGYIRPPKRPASAAALAAIILPELTE